MDLLTQYIIALTNLYGIVHKDKVVEIYNKQNTDQVKLSAVEAFLIKPSRVLEESFIDTYLDYFVHDAIVENDDFDSMMNQKQDKPHYIPKKSELLKYIKDGYFEESNEYKTLLNYIKQNFFEKGNEKASWLAEDIQGYCQFGFDIRSALGTFEKRGIHFEDFDQANEVLRLINELVNNTRIWENNGHTPSELFKKFEKQNLKPLPSAASKTGGLKKKKVGRNDPCPCGSGKKYKKCCLGKN